MTEISPILLVIITSILSLVVAAFIDATKEVLTNRIEKWLAYLPDSFTQQPTLPMRFRYLPIIQLVLYTLISLTLVISIGKYWSHLVSGQVSLRSLLPIGIGIGTLAASAHQNATFVVRTHKNFQVVFLLGIYSYMLRSEPLWNERLKEISKSETERFLSADEIEDKKKIQEYIEASKEYAKIIEDNNGLKAYSDWYKHLKEQAELGKKNL